MYAEKHFDVINRARRIDIFRRIDKVDCIIAIKSPYDRDLADAYWAGTIKPEFDTRGQRRLACFEDEKCGTPV